MVRKKKAQLKIQQMAVMLVVVTIFFAMAGMVVLSIMRGNILQEAEEILEANAITLAQKIADSPELRCGDSYGLMQIKCIDLDKAIILKENIDRYKINSDFSFWGRDANIMIERLDSELDDVECTSKAVYPNCNRIEMFKSQTNTTADSYVLLCRKANEGDDFYNKCEIGRIMVEYRPLNQEKDEN